MPANAGIQTSARSDSRLDSRVRGNDKARSGRCEQMRQSEPDGQREAEPDRGECEAPAKDEPPDSQDRVSGEQKRERERHEREG